ncbi:MAG: putative sulfate exporter family transporter [Firmicutes bacterium]|nr:putative sulfate exporter family transporter [Bacillota bacterium]
MSQTSVQPSVAQPVKKRSWLLTSEDWWAVYLGLFLLVLAYVAFSLQAPLDLIKGAVPQEWPQNPLLPGLASHIGNYVFVYLLLLVLTSIGVRTMGGKLSHYIAGFTLLFIGGLLILILGSQQTIKKYGMEYPFWSLIIGLIIGNLGKMPAWFKVSAGRTEFYIKMGIILLGANLPFTVIVTGGAWGFLEALIIVAVGFTVAFVIARRLGFDNKFAAVLGAGASVCGVSAAIAVGSSVKAKEKDVGYVISLVVLYALVLIFLLPILGRALGLNPVVTGAWIGGSELADAAGLAAAAMVGEKAVQVFSLVKLNRDVMIAFLAFIFATVSITRWERGEGGKRPGAVVIWERFPKFVIAFVLASIFATYLVVQFTKPVVDAHIIGVMNALRTWLFTITFLCIGLNTKITDVRAMGSKPIIAFTTVVVVNVIVGFILANLFFGGIIASPLK